MADQHTDGGNQPTSADVNKDHPLSDQMDIFEQLQHEFDTLCLKNSADDFGELLASSEQSDQEFLALLDALPEYIEQSPDWNESFTATVNNNKPAENLKSVSTANHSPTLKKTAGTPLSIIMLIGLAVAIFLAAIAGSFWTYNYPNHSRAALDDKQADSKPQRMIKTDVRPDTYKPARKSSTTVQRQRVLRKPGQPQVPTANPPSPMVSSQVPTASSQSQMHSATNKIKEQLRYAPASHGDWIINLESFNSSDDANAYAIMLAKKGIHADVLAVQIRGKAWYRVRVTGLSRLEVKEQMPVLVKSLHLNSAWMSKSRH